MTLDSREKSQNGVKKSSHSKFILMCLFIAIDIGLNSTLDYDNYSFSDSGLLLGLFGIQIITQITVFLVLFLSAADTFLFQVGLLGILMKEITIPLILQVIYFVITIATGVTRSHRYRDENENNVELLDMNSFFGLSIIHKILSIPYYVANIQATVRLEDPVYFNKDAWITLLKQARKRQ